MLIETLKSLIGFFFPSRCPVCGIRLHGKGAICIYCLAELPRTYYHKSPASNPMMAKFFGKVKPEKATAYFFYNKESRMRHILYQMKYHNRPALARYMGECMATHLKNESCFLDGIDFIIPVPLSKKRLQERGYNQSQMIAEGIMAITGIPVETKAIERIVDTPSQTSLSPNERWQNVQEAFRLKHSESLIGKHILLVDDVVTTGATIYACATTLAEIPGLKISLAAIATTQSAYSN